MVCKLFESFICDVLYDHLAKNDLIVSLVFVEVESCLTQLLVTIEDWMSIDAHYTSECSVLRLKESF